VDLYLPDAHALDGGRADGAAAYRVTLRCTDVADLALADFEHQNVVTGYAFEPATPDDPDGRHVHMSLTGAPGCDLDLRCAAVEVVAVEPVPADDAI
jgi:hypothetical protein